MAWRSLVSGVVAAGLVAGVALAQRNPPLVIDSMAGRDLFEFYCATCHGRDGKGAGPDAAERSGGRSTAAHGGARTPSS